MVNSVRRPQRENGVGVEKIAPANLPELF